MATYAHVPLSAKEATRTCGPSDGEYAYWPKFTLCEVQKHHRLHDGWVVVHDRVYDITTFALTHPGFHSAGQVSTALAITRNLGTDATEEYVAIHSRTAWKQLHDFQIGVLRRPSRSDETETSTSASTTETETEMTGDANPRVNVKAPPGSHPVPTQDTHPMPSWLSADRDFWKRYSGGVTAQVLAYLGAQGYPQDQAGDVEDDDLAGGAAVAEDDGARPRDRVKRWGRKVATAVAVFAAGTLLVVR